MDAYLQRILYSAVEVSSELDFLNALHIPHTARSRDK